MTGPLLLIAVAIGVTGGLSTGLMAAGLRAQTAVDRLLAQTKLPDMMVFDPTLTSEQTDEIRSLKGVDGAALMAGMGLFDPDGDYLNIAASVDSRYGVDLDVPNLVRGRLADPTSSSEVVLDEAIAAFLNVSVGDRLHLKSYTPAQIAAWPDEPTEEQYMQFDGPDVDLDVVGISRHPADLTTDDPMSYFVALPPGFYDEYRGRIAEFYRFALIDLGLAPRADVEGSIATAVRDLLGPDAAPEEAGEQAGGPVVSTLAFVGTAMTVLAFTIAFAGIVIGALLVFRSVSRAALESSPLVALGMTTRERAMSIIGAMVPAAVPAAAIAVVVAAASSALLPFGLARRADPDPGFRLQPGSLVLGALATMIVLVAINTVVTFRVVRQRWTKPVRHSAAVASAARTGAPIAPLVGLDLAVGAGRAGAPSGNHFATAAVALASAAGVAALVLGASIARLEATPAAYGWTWDYVVPDFMAAPLTDDMDVETLAVVETGTVSIAGRPIIVRGVETIKGAPPLVVLEGRTPEVGEIVLGRRTMSDLGVEIGDMVDAVGTDSSRQLRVVGEAVFAGILDIPEASWGAAVDRTVLNALGYGESGAGSGAVVGLASGVDGDEFASRVARESGESPAPREEPIELARLREIEALPWILTAFLAGAGLLALLNAIVTTARRRGHDLAVLRSVGFAPSGVRRAILVQSVALALFGLAIGVPTGLIVGRLLWSRLASSLGVQVLIEVPLPAIALTCAAALIAAAAFSIVPARRAARRPIAEVLRTE